jgi:hypothetical protein
LLYKKTRDLAWEFENFDPFHMAAKTGGKLDWPGMAAWYGFNPYEDLGPL